MVIPVMFIGVMHTILKMEKYRVEKNIGIVLKSYQPKKSKLTVLYRDSGKFTAVPNRSGISNEALFAYFKRAQDDIVFVRALV